MTIRAFSVIIPAFRCENYLVRTLESIEASIAFFQRHYPQGAAIAPEIVVVCDGSPDNTLAVAQAHAANKPFYRILSHTHSWGAGPARNTGVRGSRGDVLFFCDGDDLFFPEHIYLGMCLLNHPVGASEPLPVAEALPPAVAQYLRSLPPPAEPLGAVSLRVRMEDSLHPYWKRAVENSLVINLAVRRLCHEFVEGYPENQVYKQIRGREDIAYRRSITELFRMAHLDLETTEYIRYPGSSFDRQMAKFTTAPGEYQATTLPDEQRRHAIAARLESEKLRYLRDKFVEPIAPEIQQYALVSCEARGDQYLQQQQFQEAIACYDQAVSLGQAHSTALSNKRAMAYNNWGAAWYSQKQFAAAAQCFQQVRAIAPDFPTSEWAAVHYNLAMALIQLQRYTEAYQALQATLAIEPNFTQARQQLAHFQVDPAPEVSPS
ncbi:glycosyltransferase family 2 protein [Geitlerinema sp. PCC 7407]|uniref:glycosyltransferase family 2 protein n=1 Tax=Geitlerinema sp. PCC 7407 TaxID=1173025 RepID=UPI00029FB38F|nr:glycosyltransferase family 2 protein [Geitlerinema sp. PCC 7407]AFY64841.1 glycosyl transferase family 2 [Geitlerinema sp. PCC 7407]